MIERTGMMIGRAVASAAAVLDLRMVLLAGAVPSVFGMPLLEAARRELDQRSRLAHLRQGADRAESRVALDFTAMGIEAPLVGAAALARLEARDPRCSRIAERSDGSGHRRDDPGAGRCAGVVTVGSRDLRVAPPYWMSVPSGATTYHTSFTTLAVDVAGGGVAGERVQRPVAGLELLTARSGFSTSENTLASRSP